MSDQTPKQAGESSEAVEAGVHPIVVKIALAAVLWFLAVTWLAFAGSGGVDIDLTIVTLFFAIFFALFLLLASLSVAALADQGHEFARVHDQQGRPRHRRGERPRRVDRDRAGAGRSRLRGDPYWSCLGDFRLSEAARASSSSRDKAKPPVTHSASSRRNMAPISGPSRSPSGMMSEPRSGKDGACQRWGKPNAARQLRSSGAAPESAQAISTSAAKALTPSRQSLRLAASSSDSPVSAWSVAPSASTACSAACRGLSGSTE